MARYDKVTDMKQIIVAGGGFAGTIAAIRIAKHLRDTVTVTLIDPEDHFFFTPRVIDLLALDSLPASRFSLSFADLAKRHGFTFLQGEANRIDREKQIITVKLSNKKTSSLAYHSLVLTHGAQTTTFGLPGADAYALPLKTEVDIARIHEHIDTCLKQAMRITKKPERRSWLSFTTVGGGPSGVEGAVAMATYVRNQLAAHAPHLLEEASFTLIQGGPQILPGFPLSLVEGVGHELANQGINTLLGDQVAAIYEDRVETTSGNVLATHTVLWAAGIMAHSIPIHPILAEERGCLAVNRYLKAAPHIFAAGDIVNYKERNVIIPKNAQTAMRMGRILADNVIREFKQKKLRPFTYLSKGNIIALGETGFMDIRLFTFKTRFASFLRNLFYTLRQREIEKG
jgi:NADH dehydrogenase